LAQAACTLTVTILDGAHMKKWLADIPTMELQLPQELQLFWLFWHNKLQCKYKMQAAAG